MKKLLIALVVVSMIVVDLKLAGVNVILGLLAITAVGAFCAAMDYSTRRRNRTTSITHAARQSHMQREATQRAVAPGVAA